MPKPTPLRISAPLGVGTGATVELEGTDISLQVRDVTVNLGAGELTTAAIVYHCVSVEIEGEFHIVHMCGIDDTP